MKAHLIDTHLLVPRSRSSAKVKVKYQDHVSQKMGLSGALVFHKHILFLLYVNMDLVYHEHLFSVGYLQAIRSYKYRKEVVLTYFVTKGKESMKMGML